MQRFGSRKVKHLLPRVGALTASLALMMLAGASSQAAPANDNFANAQTLTGDFGTVTVNTGTATAEAGEPGHAGRPPANTVWYSWTASTDAPVEFDTYGSGIDTVMAVYTGPVLANLDFVVGNDNINDENIQYLGATTTGYRGPSGVKFNARRGTTYWIAVGSLFPPGGAVTLSWAYISSGVFRFSADAYICSESDMWNSINNTTRAYTPLGARITVTRQFGAVGKCIVNFTCTDDTAITGVHYIPPFNTSLIFDDFEISKSFVIQPIDDGSISGGNPGRSGICNSNRTFYVSLSSVSLDPLEDPTVIAPPRIDVGHSNSVVNIVDMDGAPDPSGTNAFGCAYTNGVACFERFNFRTRETIGTVEIAVYPVNRDTSKQEEVHYVIDSTGRTASNTRDNTFPLNAGSDYAAPDDPDGHESLNVDFDLPYPWGSYGTLSWGIGDASAKTIPIVIHNDGLPEFNEDLVIYLFAIGGHGNDLLPGNISSATVTILHNDYPAGGLDDSHNRDYDITTDPPLNTNPGVDGTVYSVLVQPDNKSIVAGNFSAYNAVPRYGIARMNANGSLDQLFDPGDGVPVKNPINPAFISCMAFTTGGKVVLGGSFPSYNGAPRKNIAQINGNGSLDTTFVPGLGANGTVWALAVQTNGQIIVAGDFTTIDGYPRSHIARLNANGTLDMGFDPGLNAITGTAFGTTNTTINALALTPEGNIYIGGSFTNVGGLSRKSVALLSTNGVVMTNFNPVVGVNGPVFAMVLQGNGKLLIGGAFDIVELRDRRNIARYNADGTLDLAFDPGSGTDDAVFSMLLQNDGRIVLGGIFNVINQTRRMCLARLFPWGEVDTSFMDTAYSEFIGLHKPYFNPYIDDKDFLLAVAQQPDGNFVIGGSFHYVGGGRVTGNVQTNWVAPVDLAAGFDRNGYRIRNNIARVLGGDTGGPGSIGLIVTNYSVVENMQYLYVKISRQNGYLGQTEATFSIPGRTDGPGVAKSGVDYIYQPTPGRRANPHWYTAWNGGNGVRALSDGIFGTNNVSWDIFGNGWIGGLDDVFVTVLNRSGFQGDRSLPLKIDMPSQADVFFLAGDNIPLGTALARTTASLLVQEDDVRPGVIGFSVASYTVNENGGTAVISLSRTNGSTGQVTVRFATTNGTAFAYSDYTGTTNSVIFRDGETSASAFVTIINDSEIEPADETINLYLAAPSSGATLGTLSNAVLSIIDDDYSKGRLNFSQTTYSTNEEGVVLVVPVTRTGGNEGVLEVDFATSNLTAIAGVNYLPINGRLHWDDGDTRTWYLNVPILHDGLVTPNKQFLLKLFNPSVAQSLGTRLLATNTIINTDFYGTLQFSAASYNASEQGGYATITVTRTGGSAETVSASFRTADGTAYQSFNYLSTNGSLVFGPGEVSKSFTVPIIDDGVEDPSPFGFNVLLSSFSPPSSAGVPATCFVNIVDAQSVTVPPGQLDREFNPQAGFDNDVFSIAMQPQGKILAGGEFTMANGLPVNRLTRLLTDGTLDSGFLTPLLGGANGSVRAVINQTDTRIVVGGSFTTFNNVARNYIARLNYDGSIDTGFNPGSAASGPVYALAETFDLTGPRKLIVAGSFTTFNGVQRPGVVRLHDDGTVDASFDTGIGVNGTVFAVAVYATNTIHAGKVVIAGEFTAVNGIARNRIARLNRDGSLDLTFDPGAGVDNTVRALALQPDGTVLLGGGFTNVNGVALNRIARLRLDGSVDPAFQSGVGANDQVYSLTLQPDNRIVVGGGFTRASGTTRNRLTRLMPNGQVDPTINFGTGFNNYVASVAIQPDGKLLVAGSFTEVQGLARARFARLHGGSMVGSGSFRFDAALYEGDETATNVLITVIRDGGTSGPGNNGTGNITVNFATSDGTAVVGVNYGSVSTTLVFPPGETMQTLLVPLINDQVITPDLTAYLALANPTPPATLGAQPTAELTIFNVDGAVFFSSATYVRAEDAVDGAATIGLRRTGSTRQAATVQFSTTTNGTAVAGLNYSPTNATLTFAPGQTEQSIKVPLFHVPVAEGDKTVTMELLNPQGALLLAPYEATLTIQDVDSAPGEFRFLQTNFFVGEGGGYALITVVRTNGSAGDVSVRAITLPGDATPGLKYIPTNHPCQFASGQTVQSFRVGIIDNNQVEGHQSLFLVLTNATGGTSIGGPNPVPLTIYDNDVGVSFATNSSLNAVYIASETNSLVTIDVYRLNAPGDLVTTVYYATTTNGTAQPYVNYIPISGTLVFNRGESHKTISVALMQDPRVTGDLTFAVSLALPPGTTNVAIAAPTTANVVINDIDSGLRIASTNAPGIPNAEFWVRENGSNVVVTVLRSNPNTGFVSVNYATEDGTAVNQRDYTSVSGSLIFTNGQLSNSFSVPIQENSLVDGDRFFFVNIFNPTAPAQLQEPNTGTIHITDDEAGFRFSRGSYEVLENGVIVAVEVQRIGFTNASGSVAFATQNGTARAGVDYTPTNGVLNFTNGEISKSFAVAVLDNIMIDGDRTILLNLSNPGGASTLVSPSAATVTVHDNDGSMIVPAGSHLLTENMAQDRVLQPGEQVSMLFAFRNSSGTNTVNMMATLLQTNGIVPVAPVQQNYGVLVTNGPSVSRPFTFIANGTNGQRLFATFQLTDAGQTVSTGLVVFTFTIGTTTGSASNPNLITINESGPATPYPSILNVNGIDGQISKLTLSLNNYNHSAPYDVDVLLVSPDGQSSLAMANLGAPPASRLNITFDDDASRVLGEEETIVSGTYKPSVYYPVAAFPAPAPPPAGSRYTNVFSVFNGGNPNGLWKVHVFDDAGMDNGAISNGWRLGFTLVHPLSSSADVGLVMLSTNNPPNTNVLGDNVVYTIRATNYGPGPATGVAVTNQMPAGTIFVGASTTTGSFTTNGTGSLVWNIGAMLKDSTATLTLIVRPTAIGVIVNAAQVGSSSADLNPDDDVAVFASTIVGQSADLAIGLWGAPNPVILGEELTYSIGVSNLSMGSAANLSITNTLPPGVQFVSASPSLYSLRMATNQGGGLAVTNLVLTFTNLGTMPAYQLTNVSITVRPTVWGILTNSAVCASPTPDPRKLNNSASIKTVVDTLQIGVLRVGDSLVMSWTEAAAGYELETATNVVQTVWAPVTNNIATVNGRNYVVLEIGDGSQFFRLKPPTP